MVYSKLAEMFAEAIPGGIVQMYALVSSPNRSAAAAGSILISALTTGFGSALVSYGEFLWGDEMLSITEHFSPLMLSAHCRYGHFTKEEAGKPRVLRLHSPNWSRSHLLSHCLLYTSPSPRDQRGSRMPSSA